MRKNWKKSLAALAAACLMLVMGSGCYVVKLAEVMQDKTLTSEDGAYSLTMKGGWTDAEGLLNKHAVLEAAMASKEKYVMVIPYDKEDVGNRTLQEVSELLIAEIKDGCKNGVVSGRSSLEIDGCAAYTAQVDGKVDNLSFTYWVSCVETDKAFVEIVGWTLSSMAGDNKDNIRSVMHSLHVN